MMAHMVIGCAIGIIVGWRIANRRLRKELVKWGGEEFANRFFNEQLNKEDDDG